MWSNCCGQKGLCYHTEDETNGLLHNSESKTPIKAGTEAGISATSEEEERHKEETKSGLDVVVVTKQPTLKVHKAQSSYTTTISMLHTEASVAADVNPNVPHKMILAPEEMAILTIETTEASIEVGSSAIEMTETKNEVVQEIENITAEVSEVPQDKTEALVKAVASLAKEDLRGQHDSLEKVDNTEVPTDDAGVPATSSDSTVAPVEKVAVEETPVKEAPVVLVDSEKNSSEPKTLVEISHEKEIIQTEELKDTIDVKHEEAGPVLNDTGDILVVENSSTEPDLCILGHSDVLDDFEKSVTDVTAEVELTKEAITEMEEKLLGDIHSEMSELKQENSEVSESHEHSSSIVVDITNGFSSGFKNGVVKDSSNLKSNNEFIADVTVVKGVPQKEETVQKPSEKLLDVEIEEQLSSENSTHIHSTVKKDISEVKDFVTDRNEKVTDQVQEATEPNQNGLDSTFASVPSSPIEKTRPTESMSDSDAAEDTVEVKDNVIALTEMISLEEVIQDAAETEPQQTEENKEKQEEKILVAQENEGKEDTESSETQKGEVLFSSHKVEVELIPIRETDRSVEEDPKVDDESADLYLGAEEIEMGASEDKPSKPLLELTIPGVETRCSLAQAVDILAYSEREWKGNTAKSALVRKGYNEMSRSFSSLRQIRGDNYCALRATLYQVLVTSTKMPTWLQDEGFLLLPEMIEAREHLIGEWVFPLECNWGSEKQDSVERMKNYLELLKKKWQAAAAAERPEEKQSVCEHVFQGGEEEYGLLEALKFLMLAKAIELHHNMVSDQEVPVFCWLLFARDTSENPQTLLTNHLSQIGFTGGVEQVEMFLLGYALQHTIQVFRLYMTDTEEFVTHYPDDHKQEWPCVCIVTEDDRHYNVPVRRTVQHQQRADIMMP